jgi:vesicle transport through interaction with t-SNAREs protein 1
METHIGEMIYIEKHVAGQMAQANIVEAQRCIKLMTVELRGKSPAVRKELQAKVNVYREELLGMQRDMERALLIAKTTVQPASARSSSAQNNVVRI